MGKLKLYDTSIPQELIADERNRLHLAKTPQEKWDDLIDLIHLSISLNGVRPIKELQGKVIVLRKLK